MSLRARIKQTRLRVNDTLRQTQRATERLSEELRRTAERLSAQAHVAGLGPEPGGPVIDVGAPPSLLRRVSQPLLAGAVAGLVTVAAVSLAGALALILGAFLIASWGLGIRVDFDPVAA